jgi:hypothetical protein
MVAEGNTKENNFLSKLSDCLFWDCNKDMLDPDIDKNLILERVFTRGTENDEKEVFNYYGKDIIKHAVLTIKYLDKKNTKLFKYYFKYSKRGLWMLQIQSVRQPLWDLLKYLQAKEGFKLIYYNET